MTAGTRGAICGAVAVVSLGVAAWGWAENRPVSQSIAALAVAMGVFLLAMGESKLGWLGDSSALIAELRNWWGNAPSPSKWYIDTIAMPGAPIFARLVPLGELATGAALVVGYRVRWSAAVALVMVLNFHFAMGILYQFTYLTNGYGLPVVGSLAALALGPRRLPLSIPE